MNRTKINFQLTVDKNKDLRETRNEISTNHKRNSVYITFHSRRSENEISFSGVVREKQPIQ